MNSSKDSDDSYEGNHVGKTGRINNDIEDSEYHSELISHLDDPMILTFDADHSRSLKNKLGHSQHNGSIYSGMKMQKSNTRKIFGTNKAINKMSLAHK